MRIINLQAQDVDILHVNVRITPNSVNEKRNKWNNKNRT